MTDRDAEARRGARLADAQMKAERLFCEIEARELLRPGSTERHANEAIRSLAEDFFGISTY